MRSLIRVAVGALVGAVACGGTEAATAPIAGATTSAFSVTSTGDLRTSASGVPFSSFLRDGWSEEISGGPTKYKSDVTLISLAWFSTLSDTVRPQLTIGLLGQPRVGTFRVRVPAAKLDAPEFYGLMRVVRADGSATSYDATTGSATFVARRP